MVLDIEKYQNCIEGKIFDKNESEDLITFNGDLKVGKSILNETFSSHVSYHKESDKIIVTNLNGPLKHLKNEWHFKEINNNTQLEFYIDFELKNPVLNGIMRKSFELGLNKIAKAFEERAIHLTNNVSNYRIINSVFFYLNHCLYILKKLEQEIQREHFNY